MFLFHRNFRKHKLYIASESGQNNGICVLEARDDILRRMNDRESFTAIITRVFAHFLKKTFRLNTFHPSCGAKIF